jgi:hypothetical protein
LLAIGSETDLVSCELSNVAGDFWLMSVGVCESFLRDCGGFAWEAREICVERFPFGTPAGLLELAVLEYSIVLTLELQDDAQKVAGDFDVEVDLNLKL